MDLGPSVLADSRCVDTDAGTTSAPLTPCHMICSALQSRFSRLEASRIMQNAICHIYFPAVTRMGAFYPWICRSSRTRTFGCQDIHRDVFQTHHLSRPSIIFSRSLWRAILPGLLCFRTFSSLRLIALSSSPFISPAFLMVFGRCR